MSQLKPKKKMGRPKLPKGDAKGTMIVIRFNGSDLKRIESAAKASQKTVSEWIRGTVNAAMGEA
jgi:predicted HicB family RNase H-like nuclease